MLAILLHNLKSSLLETTIHMEMPMKANRYSRFIFIISSLILLLFLFQTVHTASASPSNTTLFAVYAPLGSDQNLNDRLSEFKDNLSQTAQTGPVVVVALIDTVTNGQPETILFEVTTGINIPIIVTTTTSWGAQNMNDPQTLITFMDHIQNNYTYDRLILSFEGHGGGYVPNSLGAPYYENGWLSPDIDGNLHTNTSFGLPGTNSNYPPLPMWSTVLPGVDLMSTFQLGEALRQITNDGNNPIDIIIFNNCFNLSFELLTALAPTYGNAYADYVVGYPNYNFFTSGKTYPNVFNAITSSSSTYDIAQLFADEKYKELNPDYLSNAPTHHPSVGGVVALENMPSISSLVNAVAYELNDAMAIDPANRDRITQALQQTQHYDTTGCADNLPQQADFDLNAEDDYIDLNDFAFQLKGLFQYHHAGLYWAASDLEYATSGIQSYGDWGVPHMKLQHAWPNVWDFQQTQLSMNIFFPVPKTGDLWNWRTYHYTTVGTYGLPDIDFLHSNAWVTFIQTYHNQATFKGLTRPCTPPAPLAQ